MVPPDSIVDPLPGQHGRGRLVRALVVVAAVSQLIVAVVLAVGQAPDTGTTQSVTAVAPAESVRAAPATTTTTMPPLVVEAAPAAPTAVPETPTTVARGAVAGVIGAGPGGRARADLRDEAGNTWHSEADSQGAYRFDQLPPGRYQLILSAESDSAPCPPNEACIGSATAISKRVIEIRPGQELREDYPVYGPTGPAPAPVTTTTPSTIPPAPATTTSTTTPA